MFLSSFSKTPSTQTSGFKKRYFKWIDRRSPQSKRCTLTRKNLYILPSSTGLLFAGLCLLLWLIGTSYQNNLILALCYFLSSVMIVCVLHTYANLAGLTIEAVKASPVFVGEQVEFILKVNNPSHKKRTNIKLAWQFQNLRVFELLPQENFICAPAVSTSRGYFAPTRLLIETGFPLAVFRCWTWVNMDMVALIYPTPRHFVPDESASWTSLFEESEQLLQGEEFAGLKPYRAGDPIKHIAWKQYARGQGLNSKEYLGGRNQELILDWQHFSYLAVEQRISALTYWLLKFDSLGLVYGLQLPDHYISPDSGEAHRHQLLRLLATYQLPSSSYSPDKQTIQEKANG